MLSRSIGPPAIGAEVPRRRVWLRFLNERREFELVSGVTVVGRGDSCELMLDDPLISRRHACFVVDDGEVVLKDLASTNGVLVNGSRVEELRVLVPGDHITIGQHHAELCSVPFSAAGRTPRPRAPPSVRPAADTMVDQRSVRLQAVEMSNPDTEVTRESSLLDMLAGVAEKAFELGRGAEAERILRQPLENLLSRVESGDQVDAEQAEQAALLATRLARATSRGAWIDYVFRLLAELELLPTSAVIDELYATIRGVPGISISQFRAYLDVVRAPQRTFGPAERFLARRLESLEGVLIA